MIRAIAIAALLGACSSGGGAQVAQSLPERGELAAAGVTGSTGGSAKTLITLLRQGTCLAVENTMPVEVMITQSATDLKRVPAYSFRVLDLGTNATALAPGTVIKVYPTGATGSTGYVEALTCSAPR